VWGICPHTGVPLHPVSQSFLQLKDVADEAVEIEQATQLIHRTKMSLSDADFQEDVLKLIQAIVVCKSEDKSLEELPVMFTLDDLKKTRLIQKITQVIAKEL
jgi:predicted transposase YdaD